MSLKLEKVLILDGVDSVCEEKLKQSGIAVTNHAKLSKEELLREIKVHDALIVRSATKVTSDVIESPNSLKVIGRAGTGVDNIHLEAATRKGILVMNTPGGNTLSAAEHTCALICALSRSIPQACAALKNGAWDRKKYMGNELAGKVLGIIGLGRIGKEVSDRMRSFGMRVIGFDPIVTPETAKSWGIEFHPLDNLYPLADYITVHTPLIPQTRYMINKKTLAQCKKSVKIVNVARGGIVEEKALLEALENGTCGGAALDVFEEEPPKDLTLVQHPKVICTPHLGANTVEAQKRVAEEIAEQFIAMSEGKRLVGVVNGASLVDAGSPLARPWINLAASMGKVASSLVTSTDTELSLNLYGEVFNSLSKLMKPAVLKGYLESITNEANLINSQMIAKEKKIGFTLAAHSESKLDNLHLSNSIELVVKNGTKKCSLIGSTSGSNSVLFRINDCSFPSGLTMDKNLLFFNTAKPDQAFSSVASALQAFSLLALLSSSSSGKESWVVGRTGDKLSKIPPVKEAEFVAQVAF